MADITRPGKSETFLGRFLDDWNLADSMHSWSFVITSAVDGSLVHSAAPLDIVVLDSGTARYRWVIDLPKGEFDATWHAQNDQGVSRVALSTFTVQDASVPADGLWLTVEEAEALRGRTGVTEEALGQAGRWVEKITRYEPSDISWLQKVAYGEEEIRNIQKAVSCRAFALMPKTFEEGSLGELEAGFGRPINSLSQPGGLQVSFASVSISATDRRAEDEKNSDTADAVFYLRRLRRLRNPELDGGHRQPVICADEFLTPELVAARIAGYFYPGNSEGKFRKSHWR